jgi:methylenetetrahydrofolate reductase (NADPH)
LLTAYPDGHPGGEVDSDVELDHLKAKVDAGADFIVTQLFYDVDHFVTWEKRVREKGTSATVLLTGTVDSKKV